MPPLGGAGEARARSGKTNRSRMENPSRPRIPTTAPSRGVDARQLLQHALDVAEQGLVSHHFELVDGRWERFSVPFRYVWPAELDLMAELAGMTPRERWSGWKREPFTSASRKLVAVWEKRDG